MLRSAVALALLVVLIGVTGVREAHAGVFLMVDTTDDSPIATGCLDEVPDGDCSLRGAIVVANTIAFLKPIVFNVGSGVPTITPMAPLPEITQPVFMDGATGGATRINLYGAGAPGSAGLYLRNHTGSTIRNMVINGFSGGAGILIRGGGTHTIEGNLIGTNHLGTIAFGNFYGIFMEDTSDNTIGGVGPDRNVISGNLGSGVELDLSANGNTIVGNVIGLGVDETTIIKNGSNGIISILGASNQIGSKDAPNLIAGNGRHGINIIEGLANNHVQDNLIGVNSQGQARPNEGDGICVDDSMARPSSAARCRTATLFRAMDGQAC